LALKPLYIKLFSILLILGLGILAYSNTFFSSFHFDDTPYVIENFHIRDIHHLENIWNWWPCRFITFSSLALNYHFNGLDVLGYHLFNISVHLLSAIFLWWFVYLTFSTPILKEEKIARHAPLIALLTGLVFVSHPIQTQAVTFIWQRAASMMTLFYMASLSFYVQSRLLQCHCEKRSSAQRSDEAISLKRLPRPKGLAMTLYICSLITGVMAMFTKENAITLPFMILLYEFSFFKTKEGFNWKPLVPFLFILLIIPIITLSFEAERLQAKQSFTTHNISSLQYLITEFRVIMTYIRLLFLPIHQNLDYDYALSKSFFELSTFLSFIGLAAILFFAKQIFAQYRLVSFSILWFFLTMVPESSIFPFGDVIFEHRLYLPLAGYAMFLVSGAYYLLGRNSIKAMVIALLLIISCNSVLTYQRNALWKDELTLWSDIIKKSPHKARPNNSLGLIYDNMGKSAVALDYYNKAIEIFPSYVDAFNNRGLLYYKQGNFAAALSDYNTAIAIKPNLINVYNNRGMIYAQEGEFNRAIVDFSHCIGLNPHYARAYVNRGIVWARRGNFIQAMSDYNTAIEINPNIPESYNFRAVIYAKQGNIADAMPDLTRAITLNPNYADAYYNRAITYYQLKEYDNAWDDVHQAKRLGLTVNPVFLNLLKKDSGNDGTI